MSVLFLDGLNELFIEFFGDEFLRVHHSSIENSLRGHNTCFYCLGVSQSKVRDEKKYHEMTYGYTIAGAKTLAQLNEEFPFGFPLEKAIHCSCVIRNKITIEPLFKSSDFRDIHAQLRKSP